jgi:predicted ATPase
LKGELVLLRNGRDRARELREAEACFEQSIKIAQQQKAKSWELRASISLARVYRERGDKKAARVLVTQIYDQFTEGFETADLRDAKALLDDLSATHVNSAAASNRDSL